MNLSKHPNFSHKKPLLVLICLGILINFQPVEAQKTTAEEQLYTLIQREYEAGRWLEVLSKADQFRQQYPSSVRQSTVTYLSGYAALNYRWLGRARLEAQRLLVVFPNSGFNDDAHWILAESALQAEQWEQARSELEWLLGFALDEEIKIQARRRCEELTQLLEYREALKINPDTSARNKARIALLLPLTGASEEAAGAFRMGFLKRWGDSSEPILKIYDTNSDPVRAARIAKQVSQNDGVWLILGGLDAVESVALAAVSGLTENPFLTTVCASEGLASLSPWTFQGRPDYHRIGTALARYAASELDLKHLGLLAPQSQAGLQTAGGFRDYIKNSGITLTAEEYYYPGTQDFREPFNSIRQLGFRSAFDDSLRQLFARQGFLNFDNSNVIPFGSMLTPKLQPEGSKVTEEDTTWTLSQPLLDSLWRVEQHRIRRWMEYTGMAVDSIEIPLTALDGFLFLIEPGQVELAAPQFARANIRTQLLGGEEWADREALTKVTSYINGIIIADPYYTPSQFEYQRFLDQIPQDYRGQWRNYALAGERAACIADFAARRAQGPQSLRLALSQLRDLPTLTGPVSFLKEERVDVNVKLVRYLSGRMEQIE